MQATPESNHESNDRGVFEVFNQYFLLFFSLSCILASVFIQELFITLHQFRLGIIVAPAVGIILPIFLLTRRFRPGFRRQLLIGKIRPSTTIHVFLATLTMVVVVDQVYLISQELMPEPVEYLEGLKALKPAGTLSAVVTFIGLCIVVPLSEEIVFRGMIQQVFTRNMGGVLAVIFAGVFFGAIHLNPQLFFSMACFGIFLGFLFFATSNLTYAVLSHAGFNTVAFLQLTLAPEDRLGEIPFYANERWILAVALALVIILLWEIKRGAAASARTPFQTPDDPDRG